MLARYPQTAEGSAVDQYFDQDLQECPINLVKAEVYDAAWCIRVFLLYDMSFEVFGWLGIQERRVKRFREGTTIELSGS